MRRSKKGSLMIMLSHLITFMCFPGFIIFQPLPGKFFERPTVGGYDEKVLIWMNSINLGSFFCFYALGVCISSTCLRLQGRSFPRAFCILVTILQILNAGVIITDLPNILVSQFCIFLLAFLHGMTSSFFATWWPPVYVLPNNLQA